jgi:hypothetical protein
MYIHVNIPVLSHVYVYVYVCIYKYMEVIAEKDCKEWMYMYYYMIIYLLYVFM